ncbi:MAG: helix-turn-helix domain-containing protein [Planctomycetota bacterium]
MDAAIVDRFEELLDRTGRVLGLRVAFHDRLHRGLPHRRLQHADPACLAVRARHQDACAAFCGGEVHEAVAGCPGGRVHTCPFGHTEAVAPVLEDGLAAGILYAGPCWTGAGAPPRAGLVRAPDADWLADRLAVLRGVAREVGAVLRGETDAAPSTRRARILQVIRARLATRVRLADVAGALHLSPSRTGHVVRAIFGKRFPDLVREVKTREGARLLTGTELPVAEVARRLGYSDQAHFTRAFRRSFGATPAAYRRQRHTLV